MSYNIKQHILTSYMGWISTSYVTLIMRIKTGHWGSRCEYSMYRFTSKTPIFAIQEDFCQGKTHHQSQKGDDGKGLR